MNYAFFNDGYLVKNLLIKPYINMGTAPPPLYFLLGSHYNLGKYLSQ